MKLNGALIDIGKTIQQNSLVAPIFNLFMGRFTFFAVVFSSVGIILAFKGRLDGNFALFVGSIQGLLGLHSFKEDWFRAKKSPHNANTENAPSS